MARQGVFSRQDDTPRNVPRSVQYLNTRKIYDAPFFQITPIYARQFYPNESISINVSNFIRTIPMKTPQFSEVKIITRFYAVPNRIMWNVFEDYIKGVDSIQFDVREPYLANVRTRTLQASSKMSVSSVVSRNSAGNVTRFSAGLIVPVSTNSNSQCYFDPSSFNSNSSPDGSSHVLHSLGDYLGYSKYSEYRTTDAYDFQISAFKACAYQMCYSYGYRQPNVQARHDDFYSIYDDYWSHRARPDELAFSLFDNAGSTSPATSTPYGLIATFGSGTEVRQECFIRPSGVSASARDSSIVSRAQLSDTDSVIATSWDFCEKFPLKAGANFSMLSTFPDSETGISTSRPSNILLDRIRFANYNMDYFTSCNPWQQRGVEAQIPIDGVASVNLDGVTFNLSDLSITPSGNDTDRTLVRLVKASGQNIEQVPWALSDIDEWQIHHGAIAGSDGEYWNVGSAHEDGSSQTDRGNLFLTHGDIARALQISGSGSSSSTASVSLLGSSFYVSPSSFRFAMALQRVKEKQANIDNRYESYVHKFFGARAKDYRLDRPEFIGGSVQRLNISEVLQTSETTDSSVLGDMAGRGISSKTSHTFKYHCSEHTMVIGLMHIIPDTVYIGGTDREDVTHDRFDWMLPDFGHISEQPVFNYELATGFSFEDMTKAFGYAPVYNYLRWDRPRAVGAFSDSLNASGAWEYYKPWIITRNFGLKGFDSNSNPLYDAPTLSNEFLSGYNNADNDNFEVTDEKLMYPFLCDSYFKVRAVRTIPTFGTPSV